MDNKIWEFVAHDESLAIDLSQKLLVSPLLASLLVNRGITNVRGARNFLHPDWDHLTDPLEIPGMAEAAARVRKALERKEPVLIYGDYDADGVMASALLVIFFRRHGVPVCTYLPHRVAEGYGLHFHPLSEAKKQGIGLVITVDCGISAAAVVRKALKIGLELIITDHHIPGDNVPEQVPLVNPHFGRHPGLKTLSGVGVAFELVRAVAPDEDNRDLLDLVAVGTIADMAPLVGESRTLSFLGLKSLQQLQRPAFRELCLNAGVKPGCVESQTVGYVIGPRINAAGRISTADLALQLFLTEDDSVRSDIAGKLEKNNRERQKMERKVFVDACREVEDRKLHDRPVLVLGRENWHPGVIGIVAGKIAEKYNRPALIFSTGPHLAKGSGRSVPGFDLFAAVQSAAACLVDYGGHQKAVGVSLQTKDLDAFRIALEAFVEKRIRPGEWQEKIRIERLLDFSELTPEVVREISALAPFGPENPSPVLASFGLEVQRYSRVVGNNHLKLWLKQERTFRQAIGFGLGDLQILLPAGLKVDAAYTPQLSSEDGIPLIELELKSLRESG